MRRADDDRGIALVMVIVIGFLAVLLLSTALLAASSGLRQAVTSQRSTSASDAAFAGVQDYIARVNRDDAYINYGNKLAPFTIASGSAATVSAPASFNPALGAGGAVLSSLPTAATWTWTPVPGSDGNASFRYEVDNSKYLSTNIVRLRVTGLSGTRTRSLLVSLRVRGFVDYSYFTDLEMQDPATSGDDPRFCAVRSPRPASCTAPSVKFYKSDVVSGDVHSNDLLTLCSATFTGRVSTYYAGKPLWTTAGCPSGTATGAMPNMTHVDELALPPTNSSMAQTAKCVYVGPTQVTYNTDGTMTVVSPWTLSVSDPARCGSMSALRSPNGATVQQLDQDALFVKAVPSASSDPNYWNSTTTPPNLTCVGVDGTTTAAADGIGWQLSSGGVTVRYPRLLEAPASVTAFTPNTLWSATKPAYGCRNGDLYVKGQVTVQTTAAADNTVYIVGDLTYADKSADVLGLVGNNGVTVWNPMTSFPADLINPYRPLYPLDVDRTVSAAILSTAHTFGVQNFDRGSDRGVLKVFGSIGQRFRGVVSATNPNTGYSKSYEYDPLLKTVTPPKFLPPGSKTFVVNYYAGVASAFAADGSAR